MFNLRFLKEHMLSMRSVVQLIPESSSQHNSFNFYFSSRDNRLAERNAGSHAKRMSEWINWLQQMQILFVLCLQFV